MSTQTSSSADITFHPEHTGGTKRIWKIFSLKKICSYKTLAVNMNRFALYALVILQITRDAFISSALSLEPGRICMISSYSQTARPRSMPMLDAVSGL